MSGAVNSQLSPPCEHVPSWKMVCGLSSFSFHLIYHFRRWRDKRKFSFWKKKQQRSRRAERSALTADAVFARSSWWRDYVYYSFNCSFAEDLKSFLTYRCIFFIGLKRLENGWTPISAYAGNFYWILNSWKSILYLLVFLHVYQISFKPAIRLCCSLEISLFLWFYA